MKVLRENLVCDRELVNLANVFMSISENLSAMMDDQAESETSFMYEDHGLEIGDHWDWEFDWDRGMKLALDDAVDFLDEEMPEEFKAAVKIERHPTELPKSGKIGRAHV